MADLKGSKTEENLKAALAGESQALLKLKKTVTLKSRKFSKNHPTMKKNTLKFGSNC